MSSVTFTIPSPTLELLSALKCLNIQPEKLFQWEVTLGAGVTARISIVAPVQRELRHKDLDDVIALLMAVRDTLAVSTAPSPSSEGEPKQPSVPNARRN